MQRNDKEYHLHANRIFQKVKHFFKVTRQIFQINNLKNTETGNEYFQIKCELHF